MNTEPQEERTLEEQKELFKTAIELELTFTECVFIRDDCIDKAISSIQERTEMDIGTASIPVALFQWAHYLGHKNSQFDELLYRAREEHQKVEGKPNYLYGGTDNMKDWFFKGIAAIEK